LNESTTNKYLLGAEPVDCFHCPNWNGTGCILTACCMTKTYLYINGKLVEYKGYIEIE